MGFNPAAERDALILAALSVPIQATGVDETTQAVNSLQQPLEAASRNVYDLASAFDALQAKEESYANLASEAASQQKAVSAALDVTRTDVIELADAYELLETAEEQEATAARESTAAKRQSASAADTDAQATRRDSAAKQEAARSSREQARAEKEASAAIQSRTMQMSMGLMAVSNAFQDWQAAGLNGVVNNISGIASGIGAIAKWSPQTSMVVGAIGQIVGTIANMYLPAIKEIAKEWGFTEESTLKGIDRIEERIKELKEQKVRLAVDDFELEQAEKRLKQLKDDEAALEKLRKLRSSHQEEAAKQSKAVIAETGRAQEIERKATDILAKQMAEQENKRIDADIAEEEKAVKAGMAYAGMAPFGELFPAYRAIPTHEANIERLKDERQRVPRRTEKQAAMEVARNFRLLTEADANTSPAQVEQSREKLAGLLDAAKESETADKLRETTPATVKTKAEDAQKKREDAEKKREKDQADQKEAFAIHDELVNFSMGKDALEKLARETYEAKQKFGRTDEQVFVELQGKIEAMLKGLGKFTDKQLQDNETARKDVARFINSLAKQVDAQGTQLANKAKQEQKEDLALPLMARIQGGNVPEAMRETYKGHIAAGLDPQAALKQTVEAQANEINNDLLIPDGKDTPAAREQVMHALMPIGKQIVGQVKGEEAAAKKKAAGRAEREDAKDDKKEFQTSTQALNTDLRVEEMLSRYKYEAEQRSFRGKTAPSEEEIKNRIIGEIKTWLHRRMGANGRPFDPNPKMGAEATDATAKAIFESGEDKFRNDFLSLGRQNLSGIDRLIAINRSSLDMLNTLRFQAGMQGNDLSQLENQVQGMQQNQQHGRRGSATRGGK